MRFTVRRIILGSVLFFIVATCIFTYIFSGSPRVSELVALITRRPDQYSTAGFKASDITIRKQLHYSNKQDQIFEGFVALQHSKISKIKNLFDANSRFAVKGQQQYDFQQWDQMPREEQCSAFFKHWKEQNPDWKFQKDLLYDKSVTNKEFFYRIQRDRIRDEKRNAKQPNQDALTDEDNEKIESEYSRIVQMTADTQRVMEETTQLIRIFGRCFLERNLQDNDLYEDLAQRFFPYLNGNLPQFESFNGLLVEDRLPGASEPYAKGKHHLFRYMQDHQHGKGILISASNRHVRDLIKLIRLLRALNNKLPIQIMHKGDITVKNRNYLSMAAQHDVQDLLDPSLASEYASIYPEINLQDSASIEKAFGTDFPKQEIWFGNIKLCMDDGFKYDFPGYANKLLALFYAPFKEVLLLDADTIPLIEPAEFFNMKEYTSKGAYFFRDRSLRDYNDYVETNYFASLMPTVAQNSMDQLFNIPVVTAHTLNNTYMEGWRHLQESGVVAVDKSKHMLGVLMTLPISVWREPGRSSIWGDKELYWIAFSAAGDENYVFNEHQAASVGQLQVQPNLLSYNGSTTREVCSTHPGHVSADGQLLWVNSGFNYCKKNGHFRDRNKFPYINMDNNDLRTLFDSPLQIEHAIVPPELPALRTLETQFDNTKEEEFKKFWKVRPKDVDEINEYVKDVADIVNQVDGWNPQKGWVKTSICSGYMYCAFDVVDDYAPFHQVFGPNLNLEDYEKAVSKYPTGVVKGKFFEFPKEKVKYYKFLSKVWVTGSTKFIVKETEQQKEERLAAEKQRDERAAKAMDKKMNMLKNKLNKIGGNQEGDKENTENVEMHRQDRQPKPGLALENVAT